MKQSFTPLQIAIMSSMGVLIILLLAILILVPSKNTLTGGSETLSTADYKKLSAKLEKMVKDQSPEVALTYLTAEMSVNNRVDNTCHPLVHEIGHFAIQKYQDFNKAMSYQNDVCGSGYMHGVIEQYLGDSGDINAIKDTICPPDSGKCFHALGHGFMFSNENNLPASLALCDTYKDQNQAINCYDGVFMENYATLQKVHTSKYLKPNDPFYPCPQEKTAYKSSCYFYAPRYYLSLHKNDYKGALAACLTIEEGYQASCNVGVGSSMMKENILNPKAVEEICDSSDKTQITNCIDGMVSYYTVHYNSVEKGKDLCAQMSPTHQKFCMESVETRMKNETSSPDETRNVMGARTDSATIQGDRYLFAF